MHRRIHIHIWLILWAWWVASLLCVGCSTEDIQVEVPDSRGTLYLRMSSDEVYVQTETKATQNVVDFSGFTFTLNERPITFTDGEAMVEAGTYILSATNANAVDNGYNGPLYYGETEEFTVSPGESKVITLDLGKPRNARLTVDATDVFSTLYAWNTLELTDGERTIALTPSNTEAFFPASNTTLSYTLVADANKGSLVQDITGASGTVNIAAGKHTAITLNANPITGYIRIETGDSHGGEFQ